MIVKIASRRDDDKAVGVPQKTTCSQRGLCYLYRQCGRSSVVERQLPKLNVVGSIPIARSRISLRNQRISPLLAGFFMSTSQHKAVHEKNKRYQRVTNIPPKISNCYRAFHGT